MAIGTMTQSALSASQETIKKEWDAWRTDAQKMAEESTTVKRRPPKSAEPPALVLMRDYFPACLALAVLLSSVLFGTIMLLARGALQGEHKPQMKHR